MTDQGGQRSRARQARRLGTDPDQLGGVLGRDPLSHAPDGEAHDVGGMRAHVRRIRVLIAEDDPAVRTILGALIHREESLELVGVAADAVEAADLARRHQPDVAVLDVLMPGGGGAQATREIRVCSPRTRILALSARDDRRSVLDMVHAGAIGYLVKGAPEDEIVQAIGRAGRGESTLAPRVTGEIVDELAGHLERQARAAEERSQLVDRLQRVLTGDGLVMAFQPITNLDTGHIAGFEALARFTHPPTRAPDAWFADAREVGLDNDLELLAARHALPALDQLPPDTFLSVNLSPSTIVGPGFAKLFTSAARRIVLEVTEHAPVQDYDALEDALKAFRLAGGRLAIDDTGAGYASLRHILKLRPNFIKLDLSLTQGIHRDRHRRALAAAMISFAAKLDAEIVAEGIEQQVDLDALIALGVDYGQGFLLGRPAPLPPPKRSTALSVATTNPS